MFDEAGGTGRGGVQRTECVNQGYLKVKQFCFCIFTYNCASVFISSHFYCFIVIFLNVCVNNLLYYFT